MEPSSPVGIATAALGTTKKPEDIANIIFLLPAISFGLIWFFERSPIGYVLTAISLILGIFVITFSSVRRLLIKSDTAEFKKEFEMIQKARENPTDGQVVQHYSLLPAILMVFWGFMFLYAIYESYTRVQQSLFALLVLVQLGAIAYLISVYALTTVITQAGLNAIKNKHTKN